LRSERSSQAAGIRLGSILSIVAIRCLVHSHIVGPSPHSVRLRRRVSVLFKCRQRSVGTIRVLCSRSCVGTTSWMALYYVAFVASDTGASCRFHHTLAQSVLGQSRVTRIPEDSVVSLRRLHIVLYIRRLYTVRDSVCPCRAMQAVSIAKRRMYSIFASILLILGGFLLGVSQSHFRIHAAVSVPVP